MATVYITIEGEEKVTYAFDSLDTKIAEGVRKVVKDTTRDIERQAKKLCPVDTGRLRASISSLFRSDGFGSEVGTNVDYAAAVEFGTKAHVIKPRKKSYLSFKINGVWVRAKQVNHPGTKAQPFMFPAFEMNRKKYTDDMTTVLKGKAREVSRR